MIDRLTLTAVNPSRGMLLRLMVPTVFWSVLSSGLFSGLALLAVLTAPAELVGPIVQVLVFAGAFGSLLLFAYVGFLIWLTVQSWRPDLTITVTRHHLHWGKRRFQLEAIERVRGPGLQLLVDGEEVALPRRYLVDDEELLAFRAALSWRMAALAQAEDRADDRDRLRVLAAER